MKAKHDIVDRGAWIENTNRVDLSGLKSTALGTWIGIVEIENSRNEIMIFDGEHGRYDFVDDFGFEIIPE
jgi:hypothetical protein